MWPEHEHSRKAAGAQWSAHAASRHLVGTTMCSLHPFLTSCLHNTAGTGQAGEAALQLSQRQLQAPSPLPDAKTICHTAVPNSTPAADKGGVCEHATPCAQSTAPKQGSLTPMKELQAHQPDAATHATGSCRWPEAALLAWPSASCQPVIQCAAARSPQLASTALVH